MYLCLLGLKGGGNHLNNAATTTQQKQKQHQITFSRDTAKDSRWSRNGCEEWDPS